MILNHLQGDTIGVHGTPQSLSISPENVLAVAMGADGVRTWILSAPLGGFGCAHAMPWKHFSDIGVCTLARWISSVRSVRALVTRSLVLDTSVDVRGNLDLERPTMHNLFRTDNNMLLAFDVAEPGNVAYIVKRNGTFMLDLLTLQRDNTFQKRTLDLCQVGLRRSDVPRDLAPISLAVGDEQVVIGFAPMAGGPYRHQWLPPGLVEAYSIETGELEVRRTLPHSLPTALATSGTRLLIAASDNFSPADDENSGRRGAIYALSTRGSANYTVCRGDQWNRLWIPGSLHMDRLSWSYARLMVMGAHMVTVIEHATVPTR